MSTTEDKEGEDSRGPSPEINQFNLFDVIDKEFKASGKRTWLHRLYLIASLDLKYREPVIQHRASVVKTELDEFGGECEQQIRHLYNSYREETASGFLLIYPKHMIHILESSEDTIVAYLRDMKKMKQTDEPKVLEARVLLMSHDIPTRLFDAWSYRSIVASSREQVDADMNQRKAAVGCLTQLLGLIAHLRKTPKANLKNAMDMLSERVADLLPSEDLLTHLLTHDNYLSVEDYLDLYYSDFSFVDDGELVWPLPSHIFPYNN